MILPQSMGTSLALGDPKIYSLFTEYVAAVQSTAVCTVDASPTQPISALPNLLGGL